MNKKYYQALIAVPNALLSEIAALRNDDTKTGDKVRAVLMALHPDKYCVMPFSSINHSVYTITVDDDLDAGDMKWIKEKWPTIFVIAAFNQETGLQVGQSRDAAGNITGTPRFAMTASQYSQLKASWPAGGLNADLTLRPMNRMQGQRDWSY